LAGLPTDNKSFFLKKEKEKKSPTDIIWLGKKIKVQNWLIRKKKNLKYLICFFVKFFNQKKREKV